MCGISGLAQPLGGRLEHLARGQGERLLPLLEEHLSEAGLVWRDLAAIGVGIGPGNFTGIRIAVAAARGLALALKIPVVGVSQFELILSQHQTDGDVLVALPAPQDRIYVQVFAQDRPQGAPKLVALGDPDLAALPKVAQVIGHRAAAIAQVIGVADGHSPYWADAPEIDWPQALAQLAARKAMGAEDHPLPAPLYVRPADAAPPSDPAPVILDA